MKYLHFLIFFFLMFILISCKNEEIEEEPPFDFVRFEIDGEEFLLTEKSTFNAYYLIPEDNFDAIRVTMKNEEYLIVLNMRHTNLFSKELPYRIDDTSDPFIDGYMGFQLIDQINKRDTIFNERDTINYSGNNYEGFEIILTSTENNIFRANFEGTISTNSKPIREKVIRNGKLKVTMDIITEQ